MNLAEYKKQLRDEISIAENQLARKFQPTKFMSKGLSKVQHYGSLVDNVLDERVVQTLDLANAISHQLLPKQHRLNTLLSRIILVTNTIKNI